MRRPRSQFVRDKIKSLPFTDENREYVDDLLTIERYVVDGPGSWGGSMQYGWLSQLHPVEHDAIQRELDPVTFARLRRERKARERDRVVTDRREASTERRQRARDRKAWLEIGGKDGKR